MREELIRKDILYSDLSYEIIGILYEVSSELGGGYQEKYYQRAVEVAFTKNNISYISQCPYKIKYRGEIIGRYFMDFVVEDKIVLEIKRGDYFRRSNINQIKGYLEATDLKLGILINFTSKGLKYKRIVNLY